MTLHRPAHSDSVRAAMAIPLVIAACCIHVVRSVERVMGTITDGFVAADCASDYRLRDERRQGFGHRNVNVMSHASALAIMEGRQGSHGGVRG